MPRGKQGAGVKSRPGDRGEPGSRAGRAGSCWLLEPRAFVSSFLMCCQPCRRGDRSLSACTPMSSLQPPASQMNPAPLPFFPSPPLPEVSARPPPNTHTHFDCPSPIHRSQTTDQKLVVGSEEARILFSHVHVPTPISKHSRQSSWELLPLACPQGLRRASPGLRWVRGLGGSCEGSCEQPT